jgi:N-acetylglucosamine-6-phosphate deacetylase
MQNGEIVGRLFSNGRPLALRWLQGRITHRDFVNHDPAGLDWIAPPLFDLQVNGFAGIDFQSDGLTLPQLLTAVHGLQQAGCGQFLVTLITDEWDRLLARLRRLRELRAASPELAWAMAGWHLEGPFLSAQPGFHGTHNPAWMGDPQAEHLRALREAAGADPVLLTLAPERPGSVAAIRTAVALGMKVNLGHTDASAAQLAQAAAAGALGFTHLGNGCPQQLDRHDNILWRVFDLPGLIVSLIPDRIHVAPALFRVMHRALRRHRIVYVSDATAGAGSPPGRYTLGTLAIEVGPDQAVRQPGKTHFAGSALRPVDGVRRAAAMLEEPWQKAWARFSAIPARYMGQPRWLAPGGPADFCLIKANRDNQLEKGEMYLKGTLACPLVLGR